MQNWFFSIEKISIKTIKSSYYFMGVKELQNSKIGHVILLFLH